MLIESWVAGVLIYRSKAFKRRELRGLAEAAKKSCGGIKALFL
jgi:hypothetical protein